jgi:hypothetical protein
MALRRIILCGALAATSLSPAILLAPTLESRPVGAAIVVLANQPGDARAQAAALALLAIAVNLAVLSWASAGRGTLDRPLEAWELT